jgi:uncharacterized repeat protein (TIGR03943 family)
MSTTAPHADHGSNVSAGSPANVILLAALGALLLAKWRDGALDLYVHPAYVPTLVLAGCTLLVLAGVQLWRLVRCPADRPSGVGGRGLSFGVALLALAVVVGALVPARPLGSAAASNQSAELPPPAMLALTDETESWTLLEWVQALNGGVQRERLIGRRVSVVGFVHRPKDGATAGQVLVTRFVVRCCAADGLAVSLPFRNPDTDTLAADTWVRVDGVLHFADDGARTSPFVEADRVTVVPVPTTPYLVPS